MCPDLGSNPQRWHIGLMLQPTEPHSEGYIFLSDLTSFLFFLILTRGHFLIAFRKRGRKRNIDVMEKHQLAAFPMCPDLGSNLQSKYVPQLRIKLTTLWLLDYTPTKWATQPEQDLTYFDKHCFKNSFTLCDYQIYCCIVLHSIFL